MPHRAIPQREEWTVDDWIIVFHHPLYAHIGHVIYNSVSLDKHTAGCSEYKLAVNAFLVFPSTVEVVPWVKSFRCLILRPTCRKQFFAYLS